MTSSTKARRSSAQFSTKLAIEDRRTLDEVALQHVRSVLATFHGNQTNTARALGMDRKTLARKMRKWGVAATSAPRALAPGTLIAIEGLDGSGITTQATRVVEYLNSHGHRALLTREPSSGDIGQLIRRRLAATAGRGEPAALRVLSLLFGADRVEHFRSTVAPALAAGITVVSDRWYHSSLAYQRTGVERDWIMALNRYTRTPDVTVFLEVRPETGQARRSLAGRAQELFHDPDTQREAVSGYRVTIRELRAEGERIEVIDGERPPDAVFSSVLTVLGVERQSRAR